MSQSIANLFKSALPGVMVALVVIIAAMAAGIPTANSQIPTEFPDDGEVTTRRLAGEDRFATSVQISQEQFPDGAGIVYLARADEPADALSGGSLTGGPILLVRACGTLPDVIADELGRLSPSEVVALGGENAVCEAILTAAGEAAAAEPESDPTPTPTPTVTATPTETPSPSETGSEEPPIDIPTSQPS